MARNGLNSATVQTLFDAALNSTTPNNATI